MRLFEGTPFDIPPKCERCEQLLSDCDCEPAASNVAIIPPEKQTAKIRIEKRKRGKVVTVVNGLAPDGNDLPALLTKIKNVCGAGGTIKEGVIEVQGSHVDRVGDTLAGLGYRVKRN